VKSETVQTERRGNNFKTTSDTPWDDGNVGHKECSFKFNGTEYPINGDSTNTAAGKPMEANLVHFPFLEEGKDEVSGETAVSVPDTRRQMATLVEIFDQRQGPSSARRPQCRKRRKRGSSVPPGMSTMASILEGNRP